MKAIGGYFSLELPVQKEYYTKAIRLNTGRNCLEYILRTRGYNKVYIPYYTCEVVLEPFQKLNIIYEYYPINTSLELGTEISLEANAALLYTNYFGLKQNYVEQLALKYGDHLIVDNTQAFYSRPIEGIDTFYTCRKFFGVSDGAYLFTNVSQDLELEQDISYDRITFLAKRIDLGAEAGYTDFRQESYSLIDNPIRRMSHLTQKIMESINYHAVARQRRKNYLRLHRSLSGTNKLRLGIGSTDVPMVYPYYVEDGASLRDQLIKNKVFVARYWPNVLEWARVDSVEHTLTQNLLPLPIDQRYGYEEMDYIIDHILHR